MSRVIRVDNEVMDYCSAARVRLEAATGRRLSLSAVIWFLLSMGVDRE